MRIWDSKAEKMKKGYALLIREAYSDEEFVNNRWADDDVRRLIHNMMELYEGTTIMNIVIECQKEYQERYFSMSGNDWRHLIRDYVRKVTERPELQEYETFRYVMTG